MYFIGTNPHVEFITTRMIIWACIVFEGYVFSQLKLVIQRIHLCHYIYKRLKYGTFLAMRQVVGTPLH